MREPLPIPRWATAVARHLMSLKARRQLYEQFGELARSGMREPEMVDFIWRVRTRNGSRGQLQPVSLFCREAMLGLSHEGRTLPDIILHWAGGVERPLVAAAAATGASPEFYEEVTRFIDLNLSVRQALMGAVASLAIIAAIAAGAGGFLGFYFVPAVTEFLKPEQMQGSAASLVRAGFWFREYWLWMATGTVGLAAALHIALPRLQGPVRDALDGLEPFRTYRHLQGGGFLFAMAILFRAGLNEREALHLLRGHASAYMAERIRRLERIDASFGHRIGKLADEWPDLEASIDAALAAEQSQPIEGYARAGRRLLQRAAARCQRLSGMGSLLSNGILTAVILWILVATNDISASFRMAQGAGL